jgi:hypothetical protein
MNIQCWLQSSLRRLYPSSSACAGEPFELLAARNERVSFQACLRNLTPSQIRVQVAVSGMDDLGILVRRVGYVPMAHHNTETEEAELEGVGHIPGYVPDPLFPEDSVAVGPLESHAFWITVSIPAEAKPGPRQLTARFTVGEETVGTLIARIDVRELVSHMPQGLPVAHWFYADALCDWYHVEPFEERFWTVVQPYMRDVVGHGLSCLYVPVFTPPTDGVKRPTQLVRVGEPSPGRYTFDFTDVKRWTELGRACGAQYFEWTHLFAQWGVKHAIRIYRSNADRDSSLWPPETGATSEVYCNFLAQFLPAFYAFLRSEGLLDRSFFHLSDEPHGDEHLAAYRRARAMLKELAPWMKVMDALSDIRFGREGLTDIPIPSISTAHEYAEAGIPSWVYFCCGPRGRHLNRLMDTPLAKIRMTGWLFYRLGAKGFLHWGYNYWYRRQTQELIDPFVEQSGLAWPGWAYGDTFLVYPGEQGPIDSMRWEVFAESLGDYGLLQAAGVQPGDALLGVIKGYADFPKTEAWIREARRQILAR